MTDFEKKLKILRLSGKPEDPQEITNIVNSIGPEEAILLEERVNSKIAPYYSVLDMIHILLHDLGDKYDIKPLDYMYSLMYIAKLVQIAGVKSYIEPAMDCMITSMLATGITKEQIMQVFNSEMNYADKFVSKDGD